MVGVIYTAIAGGKDKLVDPVSVLFGVDYVCFTDDLSLRSSVWDTRPFQWMHADPVRVAKRVKILSHEYFPHHDWSLWIDANVRIVGDLSSFIDTHVDAGSFHAFRHEKRSCVYDEAQLCIQLELDDPQVIRRQIDHYLQEGMPKQAGLSTNHVILRQHGDLEIRKCMERWWREIGRWSRRDQISLPFVLWRRPVDFRFFLEGALWTDLALFKRFPHLLPAQRQSIFPH